MGGFLRTCVQRALKIYLGHSYLERVLSEWHRQIRAR